MIDKLEQLKSEFEMLERMLGDPDLLANQERYREAMQRYAELKNIVDVYNRYLEVEHALAGARELLGDQDLAEMAREEVETLEQQAATLAQDLERLLVPKDPFDDKNVIVEIRAAAGGDEASLFAAELLDMYGHADFVTDADRYKLN